MVKSNLKLIAVVATITLIGQLFSIAIYPLLTRFLPSDIISDIGLYDANLLFITGLLGFGLNVAATRDIATGKNVLSVIRETQSARITLAIIFFLASIFGLVFNIGSPLFWYVMLAAPVLALNYDFVLYGLGMPLQAAFVSFLRVAVPLVLFFTCVVVFEIKDNAFLYYSLLTMFFVLISSIVVCRLANLPFIFSPNVKFYRVYFLSFYIGISGVIISFQRFGFVNLLPKTISAEDMVVLFFSIKFFLFVVAAKRIIVQTFYTKISNPVFYKFLSFSALFAGMLICLFFVVFSKELSVFLFYSSGYDFVVCLLGAGVLFSVFFIASDTLLLLKNKDKEFLYCTAVFASIFVCCIYCAYDYLDLNMLLVLMILFDFLLSFSYWLCSKIQK